MPVYVTGAHVTLGDGTHKRPHSKTSGTLKRPFYFKHTCKTPYCCRALLVIFSGLLLVCTGAIMTLTGYKPALILPWYTVENNTTDNETQTNSERKVLGEPGPLRIMVYTGPIIMGVGFFGVMMAVGLFCEIKDRYLMAILPTKGEIRKTKKYMLYDMIINEFRKNYFRGIEVPIRKEDDKKHGFNIPNIKQKSENVDLEILPHVNQSVMGNNEAKDLQDFKMTTEVSSKEDMSDARRNTEPGALFQLTLGSNSRKSSEYISQTTKH